MTLEEAKQHYDLKPSPNNSQEFTIWKYLVKLSWAEDE